MRTYLGTVIKENNMLILPKDLAKDLNLSQGTKLHLTPINSIVIMYTSNEKIIIPQTLNAEVFEWGSPYLINNAVFECITAPDELMQIMNWEEQDCVKFYMADEKTAIIIKTEKRSYSGFGSMPLP